MAKDVIRIGKVLEQDSELFVDGEAQPHPIDPIRMAVQRGRREACLEILALMSVDENDLLEMAGGHDEH